MGYSHIAAAITQGVRKAALFACALTGVCGKPKTGTLAYKYTHRVLGTGPSILQNVAQPYAAKAPKFSHFPALLYLLVGCEASGLK